MSGGTRKWECAVEQEGGETEEAVQSTILDCEWE